MNRREWFTIIMVAAPSWLLIGMLVYSQRQLATVCDQLADVRHLVETTRGTPPLPPSPLACLR